MLKISVITIIIFSTGFAIITLIIFTLDIDVNNLWISSSSLKLDIFDLYTMYIKIL